MATETTADSALAEYREELRRHDWWSEYSDDGRIARAGWEGLERLRQKQKRLDPDATIWKEVMLELKGLT